MTAFFYWLGNYKGAASTLESLAKVVALAVAGWWTWQTYIRKRVRFPSANVEHRISHWEDAGLKFLHVTVRMTNTGNVLIPIAEGCTWIQQITPLPLDVAEAVAAQKDPVQTNSTEFGWTLMQERKLGAQDFEIEPGEAEEFHFDFAIPKNVSRVLIYSHLENPTKRGWWGKQKIGWNLSTVCEIPHAERRLFQWLIKDR